MMLRWHVVVVLSVLPVCPSFGNEAVYFKTGFSLEVDSHTQQDQTLIFHVGNGTIEFPADQVLRIDAVPDRAVPKLAANLVPPVTSEKDILNQAALSQGLDPELVSSVAKIESGFRQNAVSPKGALGLMQLMPLTAAELGVNPHQAGDNAVGGAKYLRDLLLRYNGNSALALAAYNAGPGAVARFGGVPPYAETQQYIVNVIREYQRQKKLKATTASASESRAKTGAEPSRAREQAGVSPTHHAINKPIATN